MLSLKFFILVLCLLFVIPTQGQNCNSTHFQFFSQYSLGKEDELNKTFSALQDRVKINDATFKVSSFDSFNITEIKPSFLYLDSRQKGEIAGKDTVLIYGGKVKITVSFKWNRFGLSVPKNGVGIASIISDEILFQKKISLEQGYFDYILADYYNITLRTDKFNLDRYDPPTTTPQDIDSILRILNQLIPQQGLTFKDMVSKSIGEHYAGILASNLKNDHFELLKNFTYQWKNPHTNSTDVFEYEMKGTGVRLDDEGMKMTYASWLKNADDWRCGSPVPTNPLNPRAYGGLQEFIEFSVFQNTIRTAFSKQILDTDLNRANWQSKYFQFFAGDLYEVIPSLQQQYYAAEPVSGKCSYNKAHEPKISKFSDGLLKIISDHQCFLKIGNSTIVQFDLNLTSEVEALPTNTQINFRIREAAGEVTFKNSSSNKIENIQLALLMIKQSINRLKQGYTFGSGWKIFPRDYPHVLIEEDSIFIYDSSQLGSNLREFIQ